MIVLFLLIGGCIFEGEGFVEGKVFLICDGWIDFVVVDVVVL